MVALISPRARRWLRDSGTARVLHVFDGVCNLVNDRGEVLAVVAPRIGPGPFSLVVAGEAAVALEQREPVCFDGANRHLTAGGSRVAWQAATMWSPRPDWSRLRQPQAHWPPPGTLPAGLEESLWRAVTGVAAGNWDACRAGARGLVGRGAGLTPAGDDVLIGIFYALWVWQAHTDWVARLVAELLPLTTTLSANLLRAAAEGEAVWQWHDVVDGCSGAVDALLAVGHTSGADAWAGFVAAHEALRGVTA